MKTNQLHYGILILLGGLLAIPAWYGAWGLPLLPVGFALMAWGTWRALAMGEGAPRPAWPWLYLSLLLWNLGTTWWVWNASAGGASAAYIANSLLMTGPWMVYTWLLKRKATLGMTLLGFACAWLGFEFLHLRWELTWPWLTLGNAFAWASALAQWYEWTGALGGSALILGLAACLSIFLIEKNKKPLMIGLGVMGVLFSYSLIRYYTYTDQGTPLKVLAVQPNVDPMLEKFQDTPNYIPYEIQVDRLDSLTVAYKDSGISVVLWPETSLHKGYWELGAEGLESTNLVDRLAHIANKMQAELIVGADTYRHYPTKATGTARPLSDGTYYDAYNTALHIDNSGYQGIYHKSRLVPGVERMPYPGLFRFLEIFSIDLGGTSGSLGTDEQPTVFDSESFTSAPVICYESIFGNYVNDFVSKGADYVAIITNDGWWQNTPGHVQHLRYACLRAIETRRSIARSANTGISAFINQRGDIISSIGYGEMGALAGTVMLNNQKTLYLWWGDLPFALCYFVVAGIVVYSFIKKQKA